LDLRIKALRERLRLFDELIQSPDSYQLSIADLYSDQLKELQILALLLAEKEDFAGSDLIWSQSIAKAADYGEKLGFVSQPIQQTLKNFIYNSLWVRKFDGTAKASSDDLQKIVSSMASELKDNFRPSPVFVQLYVEAKLLYEAYLIGRVAGGSTAFDAAAIKVFSDAKVMEVLTATPVLKTNVEKYRDAVKKSLL
jgi:hypothetical protein